MSLLIFGPNPYFLEPIIKEFYNRTVAKLGSVENKLPHLQFTTRILEKSVCLKPTEQKNTV